MEAFGGRQRVIAAHRHGRPDRPNRVVRIEPAIVFPDEGRQANVQVLTQLVFLNKGEKNIGEFLRRIRQRYPRYRGRVSESFEVLAEPKNVELVGLFIMIGSNAFVDGGSVLDARA